MEINFEEAGTCFYSGLPLFKDRAKPKTTPPLQGPRTKRHLRMKISHEHILAVSKCPRPIINKIRQTNEVSCGRYFNSIVGNAPLKVKFGLKRYLESIEVSSELLTKHFDRVVDLYVLAAREYIDRYKFTVCPKKNKTIQRQAYLWDYNVYKRQPALREILYRQYLKLLTPEEIELLEPFDV